MIKLTDKHSWAEIHLSCICGSELILERYNVMDAIDYARTWWEDHYNCKDKANEAN